MSLTGRFRSRSERRAARQRKSEKVRIDEAIEKARGSRFGVLAIYDEKNRLQWVGVHHSVEAHTLQIVSDEDDEDEEEGAD